MVLGVSIGLTLVVRGAAMVKREVVGAHYGLRDWLAQRVTAVVMAASTRCSCWRCWSRMPQLDYEHWQRAVGARRSMRYATLLFLLSVYLHAWIGVRNIFMDYVKDTGLRLVLYVLVDRRARLLRRVVGADTVGPVDGAAGPNL